MTQRARSRGHVRELRARGVTFDARGRARVEGKFISDRSLSARLGHLKPKKKPSTLDRELERWGVPKAQREILTPEVVAATAEVSERTANRWIESGHVPDEALDAVAAHLTKHTIYGRTWKHGRAKKATPREEKLLREAFERFVRARSLNDAKTAKFYERWRRIKDFVRDKLTREAWKLLLAKLGRREGLQMYGMFSVMRFILS